MLKKILNLNRPLLLTGKSGTGKSLLAQQIFNESQIYKNNFIILNVATVKEDLLESELFGYKKGAFTGANENKQGFIKAAQGGTLFIDEIGELSLEGQKKLLFALEEKKFIPIGDVVSQDVDCRFIFATNKDLKKLVSEKKFREDLYFRINQFHITLENLNQRKDKKENILKMFDQLKLEHKKLDHKLSENLLDEFLKYSWPGNFRELKNTLEYMLIMSDSQLLEASQWKSREENEISENKNLEAEFYLNDYHESLKKFEASYLEYMLMKFSGRVNETSESIGISKAALIYKSKQYGINSLKIRSDAREKVLTLAA